MGSPGYLGFHGTANLSSFSRYVWRKHTGYSWVRWKPKGSNKQLGCLYYLVYTDAVGSLAVAGNAIGDN